MAEATSERPTSESAASPRAAAYYRARSRALVRLARDYQVAYRVLLAEELHAEAETGSGAGREPVVLQEGSP